MTSAVSILLVKITPLNRLNLKVRCLLQHSPIYLVCFELKQIVMLKLSDFHYHGNKGGPGVYFNDTSK